MPIYEYICESGHDTEQHQSMDDKPLKVCPEEGCEAPAERKMSVFSGVRGQPGSSGASCDTDDGGAPT